MTKTEALNALKASLTTTEKAIEDIQAKIAVAEEDLGQAINHKSLWDEMVVKAENYGDDAKAVFGEIYQRAITALNI